MVNSLFSVKDRVVIITGGMGQLGQQFAKSLLGAGGRVVVLDLHTDVSILDELLREHLADDRLMLVEADVTNSDSLRSSVKRIREKWGVSPYGLINNAAMDSPPDSDTNETGPFETFPETSWDRVMDVNVKGVLLTCQVFGDDMARSGGGSIINIGSTYGMVSPDHRIYEFKLDDGEAPFYKPVAYSASKSALVNLTKYVAVYWGQKNVRCNLLALGGVFNNQDERFVKEYEAKVPLGRMAREDEYNGSIIYLLSDASSYVTGATMMLDGGWTAW